MKTQAAFTALLFSSLLASFAHAQAGAKEAEADKRPRIRLSEGSSKPEAEAPASTAPSAAAPAGDAAKKPTTSEAARAAAASPAPPAVSSTAPAEGEKVLPETPESETVTGPTEGLGPVEPAAEGAPAAEAATQEEDKSQPRVIDVSKMNDEDLPPPEEPKLRGSQLPFTYHLNHVDASGGFRVVGTGSDGLQPFLVDPVLADVYVRAGIAFSVTDRIAIAPHLELGAASTSADVRGMSTELDKAHLSLGLEGRYHFIHRMFGYVRVAPGVEFVEASIGDGDESGTLVSDDKDPGSTAFQLDAALGASLRLFGSDDGRKRNPRLWVFAEGGYRASGDHKLSMVMEGSGPRRAVPIELAPLDFSGGFFSTGLMASF